MSDERYTNSFYERIRSGATRSAEVVAPLVLQLLPVSSVVDVGCGDGSWLAVFRKLGVGEVLGVDGDYVDRSLLQIPRECFRALNLTEPFSLGRTFDLAMSLEVAEHLPPQSAPHFVECLTSLAPCVLFSAAIPFQGGDHHVNEQWPDMWAALFKERGYLPVDFVRRQIWQNDAVEWWYIQNILLFVQAGLIEGNASLKAEFERTSPLQICLVHPRQYLYLQSRYQQMAARAVEASPPPGVKAASKHLLASLARSLRKRIHAIFGKG